MALKTDRSRREAAFLGAICLVFVVLATANSGGYRYGIGDQAFYEPATQLNLHPELFPRDRALLNSQARLTVVDEVLAGAARVTGLDLPALFLTLYVLSLVTLCLAASQLARVLGFSPWATAAFLGLLTLRHRIAKTGANTLEGYMHPRQLAFGVGVLALTASLRNRWVWTAVLFLLSAVIHPTTALWFGALIAGGVMIEALVRHREAVVFGILIAALLAARVLKYRLLSLLHLPPAVVMDPAWSAVFANKDYIFVSTWPAYAWLLNLAYLPVLWLIGRRRRDAGVAHPNEHRLLTGALGLFACFVVSVFFSESRVALAVQLQVSRVFWLMDLLVAAYIAWWITSDDVVMRLSARWAPRVALAVVVVFSIGRGGYTVSAGGADRMLVRVDLPDDDWSRMMRWLRTQPTDWLVLAHPDHAWMYGTSVRVAASRDVVLESVKDSSISMYDRDVAMRVAERTQTLANFTTMSTDDARAIGRQYAATVLVTASTQTFALPRLYANGGFSVYDLR